MEGRAPVDALLFDMLSFSNMIEIETVWALIDDKVFNGARASLLAAKLPRNLEGRAPIASCSEEHATIERSNDIAAQEGRAPALTSPIDLPPFDQSAMDGYAFADTSPGWHPIIQSLAAGDASRDALTPGHAAYVLTGAMVPEGALFIVKQEDCEMNGSNVRWLLPNAPSRGQFIRRRGSVLQAGDLVFSGSTLQHAGTVAVLAALGLDPSPSQFALRALHIATGDELVAPGQPLPPGKIYDCNGPMIEVLLREKHVDCERLRLGDDAHALRAAVDNFRGDLLLISGGSGPGDRDNTLAVLKALNFTIHASGIKSRPGKPLIFATRGAQCAFGLPGNPLSHFVCFHAFVARAIARMQGAEPSRLHPAELEHSIRDVGDGRRTWTPAQASLRDGRLVVKPLDWAHSGDVRALALANALLLDGTHALLVGPLP